MKQITFTTFIKELLINTGIFVFLSFIFTIMRFYPNLDGLKTIWVEIVYALPTMTVWIVYCVCFYRFFFKTLTEQKNSKSAWRNFFFLCVCIFIADQLLVIASLCLNPADTISFSYDLSMTVTFIFRFLMFTAYAVAYSFILGYVSQRQQKLVAEKEKANAELQNLRSQIEPHFIFNTLNNIYALALEEHAGKTSETLEELSGLLRYTLKDSNAEFVPVQDELEFIEKYIQLHKIRLQQNENIKLSSSINWDKKPAVVAPLLLISFIENAFKYGISMQQSSAIVIMLTVENSMLSLDVINTISEYNSAVQNGFGLDNTKKRLHLLYKGKHALTELNNGKSHEVHLQINLS